MLNKNYILDRFVTLFNSTSVGTYCKGKKEDATNIAASSFLRSSYVIKILLH